MNGNGYKSVPLPRFSTLHSRQNSRQGFTAQAGLAVQAELTRLRHLASWAIARPREAVPAFRQWLYRKLFTVVFLLILLWLFTLRWGEFSVFNDSIDACHWTSWETLPQDPPSHHLVFVADPQLVDPHTYPGRPWPLSTLTVKHTDLYLRRAYSRIQIDLDPDSVVFLGDLFDGGREWATKRSKSPDPRYHRYDSHFWRKEFGRFGRIFFREWGTRSTAQSGGDRVIIPSLPGNHDLGFGLGVEVPVRERFQAYFGDGNRVDILGNHTFISLDTPSLSAREQHDSRLHELIWQPAENFVKAANQHKAIAIDKYFRMLKNISAPSNQYQHKVLGVGEGTWYVPNSQDTPSVAEFPTVLLTHVPLYREPGTPCGPMRERYPPTPPAPGSDRPVSPDERNALKIHGGYQYQNVLTKELSTWILEELDGKVEYVFSGDDHDYCEVVHHGYPSVAAGIREITVKSISWAMGVRRPGFLMVGLWNPIDSNGRALFPEQKTMETHLCLLPDQLAIFIRYACLFGLSAVILLIRSCYLAFTTPALRRIETSSSFLPTFSASNSPYPYKSGELSPTRSGNGYPLLPTHTASSSTSSTAQEDLTARTTARGQANSRVRSGSTLHSYPQHQYPGSSSNQLNMSAANTPISANDAMLTPSGDFIWTVSSPADVDAEYLDSSQKLKASQHKPMVVRIAAEWAWSMWCIARVVLIWYIYLLFF